MNKFIITSRQNPKFKLLKRLTTKKGRSKEGLFLAEGKKFLQLPSVDRFYLEGLEFDGTPLSKELFLEISALDNSEGVISLFSFDYCNLDEMPDRVVILDGVQNPNNLGSIARNMKAFGFKGLILTKKCCDPFGPKSVRASMGAVMDLKICRIGDENLVELSEKYRLFAADSNSTSNNLESLSIEGNIGLIFGNESNGISEKFLAISDSIKIDTDIDSLNVAVASGILLYILYNK
tara:strand:- start:135896 stop:136600 length:705 start_codon:yes stop_codon:yes gene_type:complete